MRDGSRGIMANGANVWNLAECCMEALGLSMLHSNEHVSVSRHTRHVRDKVALTTAGGKAAMNENLSTSST